MIRLVASDLDGTLLLNGSQKLNPEIFDLIRELNKAGIVFVAASGRQYPNLKRLFAPVADEIAYIAENGALVLYQDQVLSRKTIDRNLGREILTAIQERDQCEILLSGVKTCYLQPKIHDYVDHMKYVVGNNVTVVNDIMEVEEEYLKISVYEKGGVDRCESYFRERFEGRVKVVTAGHAWLDMMSLDAGKGPAMDTLLEHFRVSPGEAMAFGDNENDIEMLENVFYSYAMDNAKESVKKVCRFRTGLVEKTLRDLLDGKIPVE